MHGHEAAFVDIQHTLVYIHPCTCTHTQVHSVHWNQVRRDCFLSGAWDDTCKLWSLEQPTSMRTFAEHRYCVYAVVWYVFVVSINTVSMLSYGMCMLY